MALNVNFLRALSLEEETVRRIMEAHEEVVKTLCAERDSALEAVREHEVVVQERDRLKSEMADRTADAENARNELARFRMQVHEERTAAGRRAALEAALTKAGANEHAVPLLAQTITTREEDWDGVTLRDATATLTPVTRQFAPFFAAPSPIPTVKVSPPLNPSRALTQSDLRTMSAQDINRHWAQVRQALRLPD